jgi:Spy/CpxP family protein refolding chaperone
MKKSRSFVSFAVAGLFAMSVEGRAQDPIPPKPPGPTTLPATPAPAAPLAATSENTPPAAGGRARAAEFVQMLKEKVGVSDEQLEKMKPIFGQEMEKLKELKENTALTKEQKMGKFREILTGTMEELKPILTPEQVTKFKEEMEKRRAARQQKQQ